MIAGALFTGVAETESSLVTGIGVTKVLKVGCVVGDGGDDTAPAAAPSVDEVLVFDGLVGGALVELCEAGLMVPAGTRPIGVGVERSALLTACAALGDAESAAAARVSPTATLP